MVSVVKLHVILEDRGMENDMFVVDLNASERPVIVRLGSLFTILPWQLHFLILSFQWLHTPNSTY
jgi:hypothetical protein